MAKFNLYGTPASVILRVKILDSSATDGSGLTGLLFSSAGLIISTAKIGDETPTVYTQAGSTIETIATLGTYAAPTATKCRFKEYDSTNHPGVYEIHLADARYASTSQLLVTISGATNVAETDLEVQLLSVTLAATQSGVIIPTVTAVTNAVVTDSASRTASKADVSALSLSSVTDAIQERTDNLPDDPADQSLIIASTDANLAAINALNDLSAANVAYELAAYGGPTKTEMDTAHALLSTLTNQLQIKGAVSGNMRINATGTEIKFFTAAGVLFATSTLTGSDPFQWTTVYV